MNDKIQNWKDSTWQIRPTLNMPELDPEAVQFAVLESDPIEAYRNELVQGRDKFRKQLQDEKDPKQRELRKRAQMTGTWDRLFRVTTGDQVYLLVPPRSKRNESFKRATLISSDGPEGRKWLTTKVAYRNNTPTCWCVALDTAIGKSVEVELQKENVVDLHILYHELVEAG